MNTRDDSIASGVGLLVRAFARRPRNWVVLARNLVPVVGVFAFGWSARVTALNYWLDGVCLLALLVAAISIRGMMMIHAQRRGFGVANLFFQGLIAFAMFFGLGGVPYWMVYGALDLGVPLWQVSQDRGLAAGTLSIVAGGVVAAFQRGGYFRVSLEELKARANPELQELILRGIALVVLASWTRGIGIVPLFALAFTVFEVWPQVLRDLASSGGRETAEGVTRARAS